MWCRVLSTLSEITAAVSISYPDLTANDTAYVTIVQDSGSGNRKLAIEVIKPQGGEVGVWLTIYEMVRYN